MAKPYLEQLIDIVDEIQPLVNNLENVRCKHFFSGAAAYLDKQIFMSLSPAGLAIKLSSNDAEILFNQGAKPLRYFAKSPVKKNYAVLPQHIVSSKKELAYWIAKAAATLQT